MGCGLGDDAEYLASQHLHVVAFDISPTAIAQCEWRFPHSPVQYCVGDVFCPPESWYGSFDFVLECYTLQVLPSERREGAMRSMASFVAPAGVLLVVARGREPSEPQGNMPWPLTKSELERFETANLQKVSWADYIDEETPPVRRFLACYRRGEFPVK